MIGPEDHGEVYLRVAEGSRFQTRLQMYFRFLLLLVASNVENVKNNFRLNSNNTTVRLILIFHDQKRIEEKSLTGVW